MAAMRSNPLGLPLEYCSREYRNQLEKKSGSSPPGPAPATTTHDNPTPLWTPSHPESTPMSKYRRHINLKFSQNLKTSHDLHRWTVQNPHQFWIDLYDHCGIIPPLPQHTQLAYNPHLRLRDIPTFFPGLRINYAENVLVPNTNVNPDAVALIGLRENALDSPENITWTQLTELVRIARSAMIRQGVKQNDVIAALMANSIWIIVLFLACASIGAIFTSVSPDMGVSGCVSRFSQVSPKLLFADVDLASRGVRPSMLGKVLQVLRALPASVSKPRVVFVPTSPKPHLRRNLEYITPLGISLHEFLRPSRPNDALTYTRLPTDHPLVIVYSSGTTGEPKCIVSPHMSILNYKKIALLHNSLGPHSTVFQYSSTSWILWNVMNGHLSIGATIICYDGGALYPDPSILLSICAKFRATYWGTSPRYLLELEQSGISPSSFDLSALTLVTTTGATLTGEQFQWFYTAFPRSVHLSSVAGGTDIASSWIATDPAGPVYANEMQMWALGHNCDILDSNTGQSIALTGRPGELVCRAPFPSMPSRFWGDVGHKKYHEAYFEKFETHDPKTGKATGWLDVWAQHDFIVMNPVTRGVQILGRSDGVLNPSGIRFGSSEIYNIVEGPHFNTRLADTLCVGRRRKHDKDETVFLFVIVAAGQEDGLTRELVDEIKEAIRQGLSPRHVPKFICEVKEIPYTVNGKKVEIAVKKTISGEEVRVSSTVKNPECLREYERFRDLEREPRSRGKL
ncbi:acetoacetate-CoA ligase [Rhinocladiella mackenziei CBS 650.93]|uniref:Acetoacetate-CoA ligase n=1 Tax=Rhinocladiella mackenziei CBS 650.93 TaxID=1442369 RepID=A0A0D2GXT4_9EURO|nr:acetoacetate-CoA ligase [Rhinocladiella mackenziei CBS 650.93]KIX02978.1 acetoacetate-CoA ligase [Rhinocladiella mackenziei CBS 650.93]